MNRILFLALVASAALGGSLYAGLGLADPPVNLQAVTPGTQQVGNTNISGKAISGSISASNSSPTAQVIVGNATSTTGANYAGLFRTDSSTGTGIRGVASATTGAANGGTFQTGSPNGGGVRGNATSPTGVNYGVYGKAVSPSGFGVYGLASAFSGGNAGGFFQSNSEEGNGVVGIASSTIGSTSGVYGQSASAEGYGVYGKTTNPSGFGVYSNGNMHSTGVISGNGSGLTSLIATNISTGILSLTGTSSSHIVFGQNSSTVNGASGVYGLASGASGQTYGVQGTSGSTNGFGVFGAAPATSGPNFGGRFESGSSSGTGVFGEAKSAAGTNYGVYGKAISPNGFGVFSEGNMHVTGVITGNRAVLTGLNSSNVLYVENTSIDWYTSAIKGVSSGATGSKYGVHGQAMNGLGTGVYGEGGAGVRGQGGNYGVEGFGDLTGVIGRGARYGVQGWADGVVNQKTTGGDFFSASPVTDSAGVFARSGATTGTTYGVWGQSDSTAGTGVGGYALAATGTTYGAYGYTTSGTGWAVYAGGKFGASGTKSFRIDHPFDPENKYLLHYSTESPVPQNFYVGNVITDANGYAWVDLPDYFDEINKNFKYQLTVVGKSFAQAIVWEEIVNNRFQIRTNEPNIKVSWRVDADRNDLYVRNRPPKDVVDKEGSEKGTYQHPEFYGLGPERGMNYHPAREKQPKDQPAAQTKKR